jgi:hypothetical protein
MHTLNPDLAQMLSGEKFNKGFAFDLSFMNEARRLTRTERILGLTLDKAVIHIGCADHLPLIDAKIEAGTHLHAQLSVNCSELLGLDTNEEALKHLRERHGMTRLRCVDVSKESPFSRPTWWDYALLGEILEHVGDPVSFLKGLKKNLGQHVKTIIVTVPNAYSAEHCSYVNGYGREVINSDHKFWFTPYTLLKVMTEAGITDLEVFPADHGLRHGNKAYTAPTLVATGTL